jgi:hypothetical protein
MGLLDQPLAELQSAVERNTTVVDSVEELLNRLPDLLTAAYDAGLAAGATPDQLAALAELRDRITTDASDLEAAVLANTPEEPTPG